MSPLEVSCIHCLSVKIVHTCDLCQAVLCKNCVEKVGPEDFSFMSRIPALLRHENYCLKCFDLHVAPEKIKYNVLMEKAKDVYFLTKAYNGYVRVLRRHTTRVQVPKCDDRRETIVRLAFFAAELGMNAVILSEVESAKARDRDGYQSTIWSGSALPALIDGEQLERSSLRRV